MRPFGVLILAITRQPGLVWITMSTVDAPAPIETNASANRFVFLDALRGLAAVAVMLFHFNNRWVSPAHDQFSALLPQWLLTMWSHLDLGVEIFFVLSGFVIAHSLANRKIDLPFAANFLLRRMVRLAPPYWAMIAILMGFPYLLYPTLIDGFFDRFGGWRGLLINMFYLPDILGPHRIVPVAWTLCLEVQFYLALLGFHVFGHAMLRSARADQQRSIRLLIALPFLILTLTSMLCWFLTPRNVFLDRWWMFAAGTLVYLALQVRNRRWPIAVAMVLALVGVTLKEPRSAAAALTCTIILVAGGGDGLRTWLNWGWLQYLGRISYSLYLVHLALGVAAIGLALRVADGSPISIITAVFAGIIASLVAADLLHRLVEAPAARLSSRLRGRPTVAPLSAKAVPLDGSAATTQFAIHCVQL